MNLYKLLQLVAYALLWALALVFVGLVLWFGAWLG